MVLYLLEGLLSFLDSDASALPRVERSGEHHVNRRCTGLLTPRLGKNARGPKIKESSARLPGIKHPSNRFAPFTPFTPFKQDKLRTTAASAARGLSQLIVRNLK